MAKKLLVAALDLLIFILLAAVLYIGFSNLISTLTHKNIPSYGGYNIFTVKSESMQPIIKPGDMIIVKAVPVETIKVCDVITFMDQKNGTGLNTVTHKVVQVVNENGKISFETMGNANDEKDSGIVNANDVLGKLIVRIPYIGYLTSLSNNTTNYLFVSFMPILLIAGIEAHLGIKHKKKQNICYKRECLKNKIRGSSIIVK